MRNLILEGDWTDSDVERIRQLGKSLSMGDGGLDELAPFAITGDLKTMLSDRQKKLIAQFKKAGRSAFAACADGDKCDRPESWDAYDLKKALNPGAMKVTSKGTFRLNSNNRWARVDDDAGTEPVQPGKFQFPVTDGEFGEGIYLQVPSQPSGNLRLRAKCMVGTDQIISDEEFHEIEADLSIDTGVMLDAKGIKAIFKSVGDAVVQIMIRDRADILPLGIIAGSGSAPQGQPEYRVVSIQRNPDDLVLDLEMGAQGEDLEKSATKSRKSTLVSDSHLNGTKLVRTNAPCLDRVLVRDAIARCKSDGLNFEGIRVSLLQGVPDFLPMPVHCFCLPSDGVINLVPHTPQRALSSLCGNLATRLQSAVGAGAMDGDAALGVLAIAARMDEAWWLEFCIKRMVGAILCDRSFQVLGGTEPPGDNISLDAPVKYMEILAMRGVAHWGSRKAIAECMAEDFRVAHDPAGLPNLVTLEWDTAVPAIARAAQQVLLSALQKSEVAVPE
jgi:hypothetical protein